ncbi:MAG: hypothetical protein L0K86_19040 [Actinomycetia bacterium]|nr:hypothetical protein [Actinomycetes bacterium]
MDDEALAGNWVDVLANGQDRDQAHAVAVADNQAVEVDVHPADGADLADAQAGADAEPDDVGEVGGHGFGIRVDVAEELLPFLGCQPARRRLLVFLRRLYALQLADGVGRDRLVQDRLLQNAGHDGADRAPAVGRIERLLRRHAVAVLDRPALCGEPTEPRVEVGDVALNEA